MNPFLKASAGTLVRGAMMWLGGHGVDVSGVAGEEISGALNEIVDGALVVVPLLWGVAHKWWVHQRIQLAETQTRLAAARPEPR